jgi:hypothetical protein|tara:strand:- start:1079 stop:1342 length:264 start_codon:yes stop_codon:yes gene_type:complete
MEDMPKYTNYYCWHFITIKIFWMSGAYAYAAFEPWAVDVAWLLTGLAATFTVWSVALVMWKRCGFMELPQLTLMGAITVAGAVGLAP